MNASETLELFDRHARRWLNMLEKNTCIEQTRILIECMKAFGVPARAVGAKLHVEVPPCGFQFVSGMDAQDREHAEQICKGLQERGPFDGHRHVIAVVDDCILVDLTVAQASAPQFNFVLDPVMIQIPSPKPLDNIGTVKAGCSLEDGTRFTVTWILTHQDQDWLDTPAWEPSHLWRMIHRIIYDMRQEVSPRPNRVSSRSR